MGKYSKWIGGGLGWVMGGPLGAVLGFVVGSVFDNASPSETRTTYRGRTYTTTTGDFTISLLVLVAAVMKADGRVVKTELEYVRAFLVRQFGQEAAREALVLLRDILKQNIPVADVCRQISRNMEYSSRLQLMHMLFGISGADGTYQDQELRMIERISGFMSISESDFQSIRNMFIKSADSSYKILEIDNSVPDDEVKKAYRRMARKYHPDTVSHLGDEIRMAAEEKFKEVNEAYEKIKKERNIV
jgi:DnaJ like chaperone protein